MARAAQQTTPRYRNYSEFFGKEPQEIWCRNVSEGVVVIQIHLGGDRWEPVKLPYNRDPYNLTSRAPYDAIKNSTDIRRLMLRRPAAIELLTEAEAMDVFKARAAEEGLWKHDDDGQRVPNTEEALNRALEEQRELMVGSGGDSQPLWDPRTNRIILDHERSSGPDDAPKEEVRVLTEDDVVTPKVMGILRYVAHDVPDKEKKPAKQVLKELKLIPSLSIDDYEYIRSKGYYSSVINWAEKEQAKLAEAQVNETENDE